jgi:hypothetical protein
MDAGTPASFITSRGEPRNFHLAMAGRRAGLRRFCAIAASVNSNWAPRGRRRRKRPSLRDTLQMGKQHLNAFSIMSHDSRACSQALGNTSPMPAISNLQNPRALCRPVTPRENRISPALTADGAPVSCPFRHDMPRFSEFQSKFTVDRGVR